MFINFVCFYFRTNFAGFKNWFSIFYPDNCSGKQYQQIGPLIYLQKRIQNRSNKQLDFLKLLAPLISPSIRHD